MFDQLSERLSRTIKKLRGSGRISAENISDTLRELRIALLEADVALPVAREFIERVRNEAMGEEIRVSVSPGEYFISIVQRELTALMGEGSTQTLNIQGKPPVIILLAGLQGAGKTTTAAKLGRYLIEHESKQVAVCSCDTYRPAAIRQLEILAQDNQLCWVQDESLEQPLEIATAACSQATEKRMDILVVDTAGRLQIDAEMMAEIQQLHENLQPAETLFVVDSMMGQDAVNATQTFAETIPLTGAILTKTDGDARGGVALTVRAVAGVPIRFMGTGESTSALEVFHPQRVAERILGMGDIAGMVEDMQRQVDMKEAQHLAKKVSKGVFDMNDLRSQMQQMQNMGGLGKLMERMPGVNRETINKVSGLDGGYSRRLIGIIDSMTLRERARPDIINGSRKRRIARGAGTQIQEVNRLLKQHKQMQKMMKNINSKTGMKKMMSKLKHFGISP